MIEIENLSKRYGNLCAVSDISLTVAAGEIFGFLGVNGAGKTTTIRIMTGILRPTSGTVRLAGFDILNQPVEAKRVTGFVPDRPYMYSKLSGREFLYFVADLYYVNGRETEARIDSLLEEYGLSDWEDELVESYSHGMKQRLATCAALVHMPQILILDEPMVGLDPHGTRLLKDSIKRYAKAGTTIFLSTHSLNVAEEVADRLAIIHRGSIIAVGSLADIRQKSGASSADLEEIFLHLTTVAENSN